jgi:hypothetical protein
MESLRDAPCDTPKNSMIDAGFMVSGGEPTA